MAYKLIKDGVRRLIDGATISTDETHPDRKKYMEWLTAGNTPEPADPEPAPVDQADIDQINKQMKALALVFAEKTGMTVPQLKTAFRNKMDSLP